MAFRSSTRTGWMTGATSHTCTIPSGCATDDIATVFVLTDYLAVAGDFAISGFTKIGTYTTCSGGAATIYFAVFWKRVLSGDAKTGTWTVTANTNDWQGEIIAVLHSGRTTSGDPWDTGTGAISRVGGTSSSVTTPAVALTPTTTGVDLIWYGLNWAAGGAWTPPTNYTLIPGNTGDDSAAGYRDNQGTSATGNLTGSCGSTADSVGAFLGALLPVAGTVAWNYHVIQG